MRLIQITRYTLITLVQYWTRDKYSYVFSAFTKKKYAQRFDRGHGHGECFQTVSRYRAATNYEYFNDVWETMKIVLFFFLNTISSNPLTLLSARSFERSLLIFKVHRRKISQNIAFFYLSTPQCWKLGYPNIFNFRYIHFFFFFFHVKSSFTLTNIFDSLKHFF